MAGCNSFVAAIARGLSFATHISVATAITLSAATISSAAAPLTKTDDYKLVVLSHGPVGYWRFGESSATSPVKDESPHHRDGKYVNDPKFIAAGAILSDNNGAVVLDGKSYVEIPDDAAFSQPTSGQGLTVEVWMRPDKLDFAEHEPLKYIHWLGKGEPSRHEWGLRFYTQGDARRSNRISAYIWNADGDLGAGAYFQDPIKAGEWLHIVACYDPGDASTTPPAGVWLYKNGSLRQGPPARGTLYDNPGDWSIIPTHGAAPLRLGSCEAKTFLVGAIDEVAIYPRVLKSNEISLHYDLGTAKRRLSFSERTRIRRQLGLQK